MLSQGALCEQEDVRDLYYPLFIIFVFILLNFLYEIVRYKQGAKNTQELVDDVIAWATYLSVSFIMCTEGYGKWALVSLAPAFLFITFFTGSRVYGAIIDRSD